MILLIISAKPGQGGLDPTTVVKLDKANIINPMTAIDANATFSDDDISIIWLNDKSQLSASVAALQANATLMPTVHAILTGADITPRFGTAYLNRRPDIIILSKPGVLYSVSKKKNSDHGGMSEGDTHIMCLVANPSLVPNTIAASVKTTQVAPTILWQLGKDPKALRAVVLESTGVLPGLQYQPVSSSSLQVPTGIN